MNPLLTVLIPCFNVEPYVEKCLNSVLSQRDNLEVIVIDDASTDGTWQRLQTYKENPEVRLFQMDQNIGIGAVRNFGLDQARGDYIVFLDSDDWLVPGAMNLLRDALRNSRIDIVYFNYARVYSVGLAIAAPFDRILRSTEHMPNGDEKRLQLLGLPTMSWFKVYRRLFVVESGVRFGGRIYEDVYWSHALTSLAESTKVIALVLYCYRQRFSSLMRSQGSSSFELVKEYERLFGFSANLKDPRYKKIFNLRAMEHYELVLFGRSGTLPTKELIQFYRQVSRHLTCFDGIEKRELKASPKSFSAKLKRHALVEGNIVHFFFAFVISRLAFIVCRPFQLVRIYFSQRKVNVSLPVSD